MHSEDDLTNEMTAIGSTLFSGDKRGFYNMWQQLSADYVKGLVQVKACRTAANRFFHVECAICQQFVHVGFGHWEVHGPNDLANARMRLFSWFQPSIRGAPEPSENEGAPQR